jgi:3-oxoacyl-[acyl-carrier-protein] synthase II
MNTDGRHVTQPNAETMARALSLALEDASLPPSAIGYVNAHGTATSLGDIAEGTAMQTVFGAGKVPVSTIKNYIGHTLGACGAIEAIMTVHMLRDGWFAPNLNLVEPDERCGENDFIMGEGRSFKAEFAMSDNFAFGGVNTSLVFRKT